MKYYIFLLLCFTLSFSKAQCLLIDDKQNTIVDNWDIPLSTEGCAKEKLIVPKPLLYPNPTDGWLWSPIAGQVFDVRGRHLRNIKEGDNDVSELAQGLYIIISRDRKVVRFVKM